MNKANSHKVHYLTKCTEVSWKCMEVSWKCMEVSEMYGSLENSSLIKKSLKITEKALQNKVTDRQTDLQTDRQTYRQTDRVNYRVACTRLQSPFFPPQFIKPAQCTNFEAVS